MTVAVLGGFAVLILMNITALLGIIPSRYISPNDVRGISVEHNRMSYTLNFEQQKALISIFNQSIPIGKELITSNGVKPEKTPEVQNPIIYRFNASDIEILPIAYVSEARSVIHSSEKKEPSYVYSVKEWNLGGLLEESNPGEMQKLLFTTYE